MNLVGIAMAFGMGLGWTWDGVSKPSNISCLEFSFERKNELLDRLDGNRRF